MKTKYIGITTGVLMGIITPVLLQLPFITGDSLMEFLSDGGSYGVVIVYFSIVGAIIGGLVSLMSKPE